MTVLVLLKCSIISLIDKIILATMIDRRLFEDQRQVSIGQDCFFDNFPCNY